jgi:hypothetical protein
MRIFKLIIISFIAFSVLAMLFSLLIPSTVRISRAVDIRSEKVKLLPYLNKIENWPAWNDYAKDSSGRFRFHLLAVNDSTVLSKWDAGGKSFDNGLVIYDSKSGILTVQWYFDFHLKWYPWEKIGSIVFDKQMGPKMEESLDQLKQLVESNP